MSEELYRSLIVVIVAALGAVVGFLFEQYRDPLKSIKRRLGSPILSVLASAAVLIAEAVWSDFGGEVQFERAVDMLVLWSRGALTEEQVREIIQVVYELLRDLLGDHWQDLKLSLMAKPNGR